MPERACDACADALCSPAMPPCPPACSNVFRTRGERMGAGAGIGVNKVGRTGGGGGGSGRGKVDRVLGRRHWHQQDFLWHRTLVVVMGRGTARNRAAGRCCACRWAARRPPPICKPGFAFPHHSSVSHDCTHTSTPPAPIQPFSTTCGSLSGYYTGAFPPCRHSRPA